MASKSKKGQQKPKPAPFRANHTVRECLTWRYQKGYVADQEPSAPEHYLITKGGIGKGKDYGYVMDTNNPHVILKRADDGTVIEALRGWPHHKSDDTENGNYGYELPPIDTSGQAPDGTKDPWMSDLISHRFLNDAVRKRQQEEEDAYNKAAAARSKKSTKGKSDIKGNRTSQLRSIALAEKVEVNPRDLWQMPKFKNNAKPHLSTQKTKQKGRRPDSGARAGSGGVGQNGGGGAPCTCYDDSKDANFDDIYNPDNTYQHGPVNGELDPAFQDENYDTMFAV